MVHISAMSDDPRPRPCRPRPRRLATRRWPPSAPTRSGRASFGIGSITARHHRLRRHDQSGEGLPRRLAAALRAGPAEVASALASVDGTRKWLLRFADGQEVETVHIPEEWSGHAGCVSSQVDCATRHHLLPYRNATRLVRNLRAAGSSPRSWWRATRSAIAVAARGFGRLTNIVLMGMGEPLYSDGECRRRGEDPHGSGGARGLAAQDPPSPPREWCRCSPGVGAELRGQPRGVTACASPAKLRDELVPLNRKYPIGALLDACRTYPGSSNARRITFEYVMLKGSTTARPRATELVRLIRGIPAKVNLVPFNPWPGAPTMNARTAAAIATFSDIVFAAGYSAPVRTPRGRDVLAAYGQLRAKNVPGAPRDFLCRFRRREPVVPWPARARADVARRYSPDRRPPLVLSVSLIVFQRQLDVFSGPGASADRPPRATTACAVSADDRGRIVLYCPGHQPPHTKTPAGDPLFPTAMARISATAPIACGALRAMYGVLMVEYRGYGGARVAPSRNRAVCDDARTGLDFLRREGNAADRLVLSPADQTGTEVARAPQMAATRHHRRSDPGLRPTPASPRSPNTVPLHSRHTRLIWDASIRCREIGEVERPF